MANKILHKRSSTPGSRPTTGNLDLGELAQNTADGTLFLKKDNGVQSIQQAVITDGQTEGNIYLTGSLEILGNSQQVVEIRNINTVELTGSLDISGSVTASFFVGDGSGLTGILFDIGEAASFSTPFTSQTTVTVVHNLNTELPFVQVYDTNDELFIPLTVKVIDEDTIRVDFSEASSGKIIIAKGGHVVQGTAENAENLNGQPGSFYLDYNNFTNLPPAGDSFPYTGSAIITGSLNVIGPISSSGNIVPTTATQDLGTVISPWRDLYVSTSSIKFSDGVETVKTLTVGNLVTTESLALQLPSGIISGSAQISMGGDLTGTANNAQIATGVIVNDDVNASAGIVYTKLNLNGSNIVSGSFQVSYTGLSNIPAGIISGSDQISTNIRTERLEMGVHFPGSTVTTGAKGRKTFGQSGTIVGWKLVSDTSTTSVIDVWKANNSIPTNSNSITGTAKPSLTAAQLNSSSTLTGWTTSVTAGDVFILEVESNNNASYIYLELDILLSS
jgi:hypothetical protein